MAGANAEQRQQIFESSKELEIRINDYLNDIPENITYSILPVIRSKLINGDYKTVTISEKSIKITKNTSRNLLVSKLIKNILNAVFIYDLQGANMVLYILDRPWLSERDFNSDLSKVTEVLDNLIEKEIYSWSKMSELNNSDKVDRINNYKYKNNFMDNYGISILDKSKILIAYKLNEYEYASVVTYSNESHLLCNKVLIKDFNTESLSFEGEAIITWVDTKTNFGFTRELNKSKYYYDKNNYLFNVEINYNQPKFPIYKFDSNLNEKIATIDFETYGINSGLGHHQVYAAGFAFKNKTDLFYIEPLETSEQFVNRFFYSIFMDYDLDGYTIYIHNLGRFDSVFIIKSLIINKEITIVPLWKDNSILSLEIKYLGSKVTILDSLQLIPDKLENILESYHCETKKGLFPYSFVIKKNLFYKGIKPSKDYYNKISDLEYLSIPDKNWDMRKETLNYLKSDVEGLLEAVLKFRDSVHNKYNLNITKFKTLPGLALATFTSKYIPNNLRPYLNMIKGNLEAKLRTSYFGGNVDVYINEITSAYYYDMNSQYAKAMLNDMPIGNPVLSLEKDLNKIFGFIYGKITPPDYNVLQNPFIQYRDPITNLVYCPRGKFNSFHRLIFSEEIKYALKFGYNIDIEYSYIFERGKNLFKDFVNDHYELKKTAKDPVQRNIAKLFLNSLYGRLGMNEITDRMEIVDKETVEYLDNTYNASVISELSNNKYLVKYNNEIDSDLKDLYSVDLIDLNKKNKSNKTKLKDLKINKSKTITSAVHIAAAISSYARILINDYKNIPGNPCIMSDTDSAVLPYPLSNHLVGKELGQMKLVHKVKRGVFIRKKLYAIIDDKNNEIIKSSGVDPNSLNYKLFVQLLKGETIVISGTHFNPDWKNLAIKVSETSIRIPGLKGKLKTIYNTPDVNYKFIFFPKKYNIIIHPMFPYTEPVIKFEKTVKIKQEIIKKESDFFLIFSKLEVILFFILLFFSFIFILIYIYLFKI